ncbi:septum formation family protein [Actinomadura graeca]|uniref:Septum formation family protein n=1 Tax=Actinomadura graeca TaxID=2750812 RepID=A0ABX8QTQ0_9ACTN|nr:DUF4190 domain-containing protein [Actinomadura graeca]QXJ22160.1 septum formation family protein [Actinomadura graeca]
MPGEPSSSYGSGPPLNNDKTNGLAIGAFVTGLIPCVSLLGLILGVISLRQIGRLGGKGRGLAMAGIALFCVWLAASIAGYALLGGDDSDKGTSAKPKITSTKPKKVDAKKMKVGDCINDNSGASTSTSADGPVEVESVKIVPCTGPHDGEVLAAFKLGGLFPSENEMSQKASAGCKRLMAPRLRRDPAAASLATSYYYPTAESWTRGDRDVTCVAVHATEGKKLTRPIRR